MNLEMNFFLHKVFKLAIKMVSRSEEEHRGTVEPAILIEKWQIRILQNSRAILLKFFSTPEFFLASKFMRKWKTLIVI